MTANISFEDFADLNFLPVDKKVDKCIHTNVFKCLDGNCHT